MWMRSWTTRGPGDGATNRATPRTFPPAERTFACLATVFFVSADAHTKHVGSKVHRKRLKQLAELERYERSEAAARRVDNGTPLRRSTVQWLEQVRAERAAADAAAALQSPPAE